MGLWPHQVRFPIRPVSARLAIAGKPYYFVGKIRNLLSCGLSGQTLYPPGPRTACLWLIHQHRRHRIVTESTFQGKNPFRRFQLRELIPGSRRLDPTAINHNRRPFQRTKLCQDFITRDAITGPVIQQPVSASVHPGQCQRPTTGQITGLHVLPGPVFRFLLPLVQQKLLFFRPVVRSVEVHPGEPTTVNFYAENPTAEPMVGQAVPSLAPSEGTLYFHKTECFCFNQQPLEAGESTEMPLIFIVDKDLPAHITKLTLSYTLYDQGKQPAVTQTSRKDTTTNDNG